MYIGSLLKGNSGVNAEISFTRIGTSVPISLIDNADGIVKMNYSESPLALGKDMGVKWDDMLLSGIDIALSFSKTCFIDTLYLTLPASSAVKSAEILYKTEEGFKTAAVLKGNDRYTGEIKLTAGVSADTVIIRLKACLVNIIIRGLDIFGGVFDDDCIFPIPNNIEYLEGEKMLLTELSGADDDRSEDAVFAKEMYLEMLSEKGLSLGAYNNHWYSGTCVKMQFSADPSLEEEEYKIVSDSNGCIVTASTRKGFVYAVGTLLQLTSDGFIPKVKICDKPFLKMRGFHMGIPARSKMPFARRLIKYILAPMKYNVIFLELGGGMRYDSHPEINEMWVTIKQKMESGEWPYCGHIDMDANGDIIEKDEMRDFIAYANSYGIEIVPEVQSLSHVQYLTKAFPEIAELSEEKKKPLPEDLRLADIPTNDFYPDSYCPCNEKSYEILFDVLDEVIEVFKPKKYVHMGHDEVYTHNACPICKDKTAAEVVASDINRIHAHLKEKGLGMIIWGDMVNNINWYAAPDAIDLIPKDIVLLDFIWYFRFNEDTETRLIEHGFNVAVGNMYSSHFPRYESRIRREGMVGAQLSTWVEIDEKVLSYEGKMYDTIFTSNMMWSDKYDSRAFFTYAKYITGILPEIRSRIGFDADNQLPSRNGSFKALAVEATKGIPSSILNNIPKGNAQLKGILFDLGNAAAVAAQGNPAGAPLSITVDVNDKADSLAFLAAAGNPVMRIAWKTMIKLSDAVIEYEDGSTASFDFEYGYNIYDVKERYGTPLEGGYYRHEGYSGTYAIDDSFAGKTDDGSDISLRSYEWVNPSPEKTIKKVTLTAVDNAPASTYLFGLTAITRK
ncbi:MAG: hypothetical protein E7665_10925 [Ruminococcaceae bacterium]|nr:hypothetical protein [Oscillospiraceae bacterium]